MKELSIEEKAKAYDKAIKVAADIKAGIATYITDGTPVIDAIFPELKESEDERIRKELIDFVKSKLAGFPQCEKFIAWLEKQGEQNLIMAKSPQLGEQKPAWSEEDEAMWAEISDLLWEGYKQSGSKFSWNNIRNWVNPKIKSLKDRIQPKQEWKQENTCDLTDFENTMMHIGESFFGNNAGLDPNDTNIIKEQANLLLELVPNQEWSEEDEEIWNKAKQIFPESLNMQSAYVTGYKDAFRHFSLKNEWSEEDEKYLNFAIDTMKTLQVKCTENEIKHYSNSQAAPYYGKVVDWLKSLRLQKQWKPSKEQLYYLSWIANIKLGDSVIEQEASKHLSKLYEQLKQF